MMAGYLAGQAYFNWEKIISITVAAEKAESSKTCRKYRQQACDENWSWFTW